jgi:RHS repeat-associated protein
MTRMKRGSRKRAETTAARAEEKGEGEREAERYAGAFARAKLVRAWIAVAAAMVAMLYAYVAFLERLERWWASFPSRFRARLPTRTAEVLSTACAVLAAIGLLALAAPRPLQADEGRLANRVAAARSRFSYVTITHSGNGSASVYTNATASTTFTVRNDGSPLTALLSVSNCTGSISCGSVSPAAGYLGTGNSMPVTVSFTGGIAAGSGSFRLVARDASDNSVMNYYDVYVTVSVDPDAPTLSFAPHLGDRRDVSQCVAECFESTFAYTTPAYISLDVPRSATLLYRSGSAYPHGKLMLDASSANAPAGSTFRLLLLDQNGANVTFTNSAQALYFARNTSGPTRIVAQFDAAQIPTSSRLYTAYLSTIRSDGSVFGTKADTVRIVVINDRNSPYGAGVSLVGIQRIWFNQPGGVLVTDGTGSATFFSGTCDANTACTYTSPSGEFSTLSTSGGFLHRMYPDGTHLTYWPSGHHRFTYDRFGNATLHDYGWNGPYSDWVPTMVTDPVGQTIVFNYHNTASAGTTYHDGSLGQISIQQGARLSNFGVLPAGNLEHLVDADAVCCSIASYDGQHRLTQFTTKAGAVTTYSYRYGYGATPAYIDAPSVVVDGSSSSIRPRTQLREAWSPLLDSAAVGRGTSLSNALAVPTDPRASIIDARGSSTFLTTNRFGSATKVEAPLIPAAYAEYDSLTGQLTRSVSPTGHVVRFTWNGSKLVTQNDSTLGKVDSLWYASQYSLPAAIKSTDGQQWFWYDSLKTGWPLKKSAPTVQGPFTLYFHDSFGRDSVIEDPFGHRTSYGYATSGLRDLTSVTAPNQQTTTVGRNAWGIVQSSTAPNGAAWTSVIDVLNRPAWMAGQYGDTTKYQYDALNQLAVLTDAKGQADTLKRNALAWVWRHVYANGAADSTAFDSTGNVVYSRSRAGREVRYVYDALGRLVKRTGLATQSIDSLWYDPNGKWVTVQSRIGSTVLSTDTDSTNEQSRTARSVIARPSGITWSVQSVFNSGDPGISSVFLNKRVNNADSTVAYAHYRYYDTQKRLTAIESASDTAGFHYNGESLVDTISLRSGLTEVFTFTSSHQLATRGYVGASGVDAPLHRWYRTDSLQRITERGGPDSLFQAFTYDSLGRLRSWAKKAERSGISCVNNDGYGYSCTGPTPWLFSQVTPTYDKVGNPTDAGLNAVTTTGNRLTSFNGVTMTYDADGYMRTRVTSTTTDSLSWDEFGRLVSVKRVGQAQPTTFAYDGFGRRIKKTTTTGTTEYLWGGEQLLAELDGGGNVKRTYAYRPGIDQPRSVTTGGETYFFSTEPDGTVDGVIRKSDRTVVAQYAYTPWGELESTSQAFDSVSNLRWKGLLYDSETGFYYMRARYYDPKTRRFISEDPIGLEGGINVYAFAGGDPVNGSDPSGLDQCWLVPRVSTTAVGHPGDVGYLVLSQEVYWVQQCNEMTAHQWSNPSSASASGQTTGGGTRGYTDLSTSADATRVAPPLDRTARMYRLSCQAGSIVTGWKTGAAGGRVVGAAWGAATYGEAFAEVGTVAGGVIGGLIGAEGVVTAPAGASFGASAGRVLGYGAAAIYGARKGGQIFGTLGAAAGTFAAFSCH